MAKYSGDGKCSSEGKGPQKTGGQGRSEGKGPHSFWIGPCPQSEGNARMVKVTNGTPRLVFNCKVPLLWVRQRLYS